MALTDTTTFEQLQVILRRHLRWSQTGNGYIEEALELIEKTLADKQATAACEKAAAAFVATQPKDAGLAPIKTAIATATRTLEAAEGMLTAVLRIFREDNSNHEMPVLDQVRLTKQMLSSLYVADSVDQLHGDFAELMASIKQARGVCADVAAALGDNLDREVGSAASITALLARHQEELAAAKAEGRKEALTQCEQLCEDIAMKWQKIETPRASGAKAGALDCLFAVRAMAQGQHILNEG